MRRGGRRCCRGRPAETTELTPRSWNVQTANEHYEAGKRQRRGDWAAYGAATGLAKADSTNSGRIDELSTDNPYCRTLNIIDQPADKQRPNTELDPAFIHLELVQTANEHYEAAEELPAQRRGDWAKHSLSTATEELEALQQALQRLIVPLADRNPCTGIIVQLSSSLLHPHQQ